MKETTGKVIASQTQWWLKVKKLNEKINISALFSAIVFSVILLIRFRSLENAEVVFYALAFLEMLLFKRYMNGSNYPDNFRAYGKKGHFRKNLEKFQKIRKNL